MYSRRALLAALAAPNPRARLEQVMGPCPKPARATPFFSIVEGYREPALTRRLLSIEAEPGDSVPAWLLLPQKPNGRAALCLHQTTKIGKDEPAGLGGLPNLHYARELAMRGFTTLAPDYPNFGTYKFDPYAHGYVSATMKGIVNHRAAVSVLARLAGPRIAAVGHSLGGHNALFLAAFDDRVRAVVTSCGFTSFAKYKGGDLKGWSHAGYMPRIESEYGCDPKRMPFDFPDVLKLIAPRPLFISAPAEDDNFDAEGVQDCVAEVRDKYAETGGLELLHPDTGHDFPEEARERAYTFLTRFL